MGTGPKRVSGLTNQCRYKLPGTAVRQGGRVPPMLHFLFQAQVPLQLAVSLFACPLLLGGGEHFSPGPELSLGGPVRK